jgi:hypothetical protein
MAVEQTEKAGDDEIRVAMREQAAKLPAPLVDFYYQSAWGDMIRVALGEEIYGHRNLYMAFTMPMNVAEELIRHMSESIDERKQELAKKAKPTDKE